MIKRPDHPWLDAFLTNAEAVVDAFTDNEAVRSVPVVGTAFKICKGLDDIRSRTLMAKLVCFLSEPALQDTAAREALARRMAQDPDTQARIGETLFLVIDKMTDMQKPRLLAKVFAAYLRDDLKADDVRHLAHIIDQTFVGHLELVLDAQRPLYKLLADEVEPLRGTGLLAARGYSEQMFMLRRAVLGEETRSP